MACGKASLFLDGGLIMQRMALLFLVSAWAVGSAHANEGEEFFEERIRPLLAEKCNACHTASALGGLRLDSREAMLKGGKTGPAIVAGDSANSLLIRAVAHADPNLKMPMAGDKLAEREIADLRTWVDAGAPWPAARGAADTQGRRGIPNHR
jgi:mono/diheme cytochrome c family protein